MYKLIPANLAKDDLEHILLYISVDLAAPTAAANFADKVSQCYQNLKNTPFMYEKCRAPRLARKGYRRAVIQNYVLIYRVDESSNTVYILRVFYGARDYEQFL